MSLQLIAIIIIVVIILFFLRKLFKGPRATPKNMKDKIVIITGSSAGIGSENARELLKYGATVVFACRDENKTMKVINKIKEDLQTDPSVANEVKTTPYERAHFIQCQLSSFKSVKAFAEEFKRKFDKVDIIINNAGYLAIKFKLTENGIEDMIQTNHYSHVLLTYLLLDHFSKEEGRVINVSSIGHAFSNYGTKLKEFSKDGGDQFKSELESGASGSFVAYGNTKLANVIFSKHLADLAETNPKYKHIRSYSNHPGAVDSEFNRWIDEKNFLWVLIFKITRPIILFFMKNNNDGAQTQLFLSYEDASKLSNGGYYKDCALSPVTKEGKDKEILKFVMEETFKAIKEFMN